MDDTYDVYVWSKGRSGVPHSRTSRPWTERYSLVSFFGPPFAESHTFI